MNWDHVRFFLAVAREGSVSAAARHLGVNYTTVVRRIDAFEDHLNTRLFERLPGGYVLTAAAEAVYEEAAAMEDRAVAFDRILFGQDRKLGGRLRVATSDAVATTLLIPHLERFQNAHPDIQLEVATSDSVVSLDRREADVAVRMTGTPPEHLIGKEIVEASYGVFASKRFRAAFKRLNHPSVPALTWFRDEGSPAWRQREFDKTTQGLRFDSPIALLAALHAGLGIGSLPSFLVAHDKDIVRVNRRPVDSGWGLWILSHPDTKTTARVRAFRSFLAEILNEQRDDIGGS